MVPGARGESCDRRACADRCACGRERLRALYENFSMADARAGQGARSGDQSRRQGARVFPQGKIAALDLGLPLEMVHFACTSRGHQQSRLCADREGIRRTRAAADARSDARRDRARSRSATRALRCSRARMGRKRRRPPSARSSRFSRARLDRQIAHLRRQEYLGKAMARSATSTRITSPIREVDWLEHSRSFVEGWGSPGIR